MNANITPQTCRVQCRKTWAIEHGASVPGGPFPGTHGSVGDVRRCEHGRMWLYDPGQPPYSSFDYWNRLRWWGAADAVPASRAGARRPDVGSDDECLTGTAQLAEMTS